MSIEKAYNSWAKIYDTNKNETRDLDKKSTIKILKNYPFETVLELGCGTGKNTVWLSTKAKKIIALDFSQKMLNKAKKKIQNDDVIFKKANLLNNWEVENEFADLITSSLTLEHIKDLNFIFSQAHLKLKTNGIFFINELHPFKQYSGSKARFDSEKGTKVLEVYTHHISDYINSAKENGFKLKEIYEQFDDSNRNEIPRLISFIFKKID
ncbi:class I SAM-dependent methyltransferase [Lutibacter sp.]|uniref:class I SAM-dependent DNA methyltransferase n=1 Tax=Lutibacter sp. TaxID=1925666 RepID=UPI0025C39135|nr:class I SAM-dependent methyltransferase [Lutibacter sp.]MCF6181828.1 class I SAM-dependent methyltransferase [Lutibacter sp.]